MAPAAGPGWEEPTSQSIPPSLAGSDYVFTHAHSAWGRRMIARTFSRPHDFCPGASESVESCDGPGHLIGRKFCAPQSLRGHTDCRPSYLWKKPRPTLTGLRYRWTARLGRARASAILSDSECCREMSFILLNLQLSFPIVKKKCPNGANFLGRNLPRLLSLAASSLFAVDFPRRCPFSVILSVPF